MAQIDISLLTSFSRIFPFILVWVVVFALLEWRNIFGDDRKGIRALTAFVVAMIFLLSPQAGQVIEVMTPWFIIILIFLLLMLIIFKLFGASDSTIKGVIEGNDTVIYWIIIISIIIFFAALGKVYFTGSLPTGEQAMVGIGADNSSISDRGVGAFWQTLFHPKILGVIFILLLAVFTIKMLSGTTGVK